MELRLNALRQAMAEADAEAFVSLSAPANAYLSAFHGSASALVVDADSAHFLCDFRYGEQAEAQVSGYDIAVVTGKLEERAGERLKELGAASAGFDPAVMNFAQYERLGAAFGNELRPLPYLVNALRAVKDAGELAKIRAANDLAEAVLSDLKAALEPGVTEREVAARMIYDFQTRGAEKASFDPIVLFGERTSLPHGVPGERALAEGDIVLIDMGCQLDGYCSDLTRTYVFGRIPGAWFVEIYGITLRAQLAALAALRAGALGKEVDAAGRSIIQEAGYGEQFGHGLGHGIGLEVHESIRLNAQSDTVLEPGMTLTIEPGIYLPGKGGVRIEDLVVVTENGCGVMTQSPKDLEVIPV